MQILHGTSDDVVPEQLGRKSVTFLRDQGFTPGYQTFPMGHSVCLEEIEIISLWLQQVLD